MTGQPIQEDDVPPVLGNRARNTIARRDVRHVRHDPHRQRRIAAQMMGMSESEEEEKNGIFPDGAKEIESPGTDSSIKTDDTFSKKNDKPNGPTNPYPDGEGAKEPLMAPSVALVAPDVTPDALEPLDPSEVPMPPEPPEIPKPAPVEASSEPGASALDVLLGRGDTSQAGPPVNPAAGVARAESLLGITPALDPGNGMPVHQAGNAKQIIESFRRFGGV